MGDGELSIRIAALTPELFASWVALFDACASGCFCRYWHFEGTKNEWLERLAVAPQVSAEEQRACLHAGHPSARGLVALDGDDVVGWLKVVPRDSAQKLRRLPVYRALDLGPDEGVSCVACVLVRPSHRRHGVARALLRAAVAFATARGDRTLEAYPHRRTEALRDEELWMGPISLFEHEGFRSMGGNDAYPVLRRDLRDSGA
jgi:GNAT superfamily N-acetyltransferase